MHKYSKWWDKIQKHSMGHVQKTLKIQPSIF